MYKRMLVPLDGSELSEVVFEYAKEIAIRLGMDLILLNVCIPEESDLAPMHRAYVTDAAEIVNSQSQDAPMTRSRGKIPKVRGEMVFGEPAEEILNYARSHNIDAVLMVTHCHSGAGCWILGNVTTKVVSKSSVPVWLVPEGIAGEIIYDEWPAKKILVPLDGSEYAESVLPHVEALAKQWGAGLVEIVLLRVCGIPLNPSIYEGSKVHEVWREHAWREIMEREQTAKEYLAEIENRLTSNGLKVQTEVLAGKPANEIIGYIQHNPFNLIVMSTYGQSGIMQWAHGSVTDKVIRAVSSPVFLVKPRLSHHYEPVLPFINREVFEHV